MTLKTKLKKRRRKYNPENFEPGFYYQASTKFSDFPLGPVIVYIGVDGSVYSIDLKTTRFFKNIEGTSERKQKYLEKAYDPSYFELFIEPIKNDKFLRYLNILRINARIL